MAKRLTAEEKGKGIATKQFEPRRIRIQAPDFDPSSLIQDNALTLIGRLTNPREQKMVSVLSYLPKRWNLLGRVIGSELGDECFQFRFDEESELKRVLNERPYQFGRWMIILQRWEPIISPTFPSQIPFWINIKGIPLHFWHEKVLRDIEIELGLLEAYQLTKTSARIRLLLDGLKPIVKETILEFDSGEETNLVLDYENLGNHCSYCNRLTHLRSKCPEREQSMALSHKVPSPPSAYDRAGTTKTYTAKHAVNEHRAGAPNDYKAPNDHFHQRVDRHGNPFGQRVAAVSTTVGVRNKITPVLNRHADLGEYERQHRAYPSRHYYGNSPPYFSRRVDRQTQRSDSRKEHSTRGTPEIQGTAIWREKQPTEERLEEDSQNLVRSARPPVGRNLETHDFPPLPLIPTTEEVMEELQQVTRLYTSCDDPIESAARKQRVLVSDAQGLMEETAQGIIIAAQKAQAAQTQLQEEILDHALIILLPAKPTNTIGSSTQQPTTGITGKKRGRPARTRDLRISPKTFTGASSRRRIMSNIHSSPGGAAGTPRGSKTSRGAGTSRRRNLVRTAGQNSAQLPPLPPTSDATTSGDNPVDFHRRSPPLP